MSKTETKTELDTLNNSRRNDPKALIAGKAFAAMQADAAEIEPVIADMSIWDFARALVARLKGTEVEEEVRVLYAYLMRRRPIASFGRSTTRCMPPKKSTGPRASALPSHYEQESRQLDAKHGQTLVDRIAELTLNSECLRRMLRRKSASEAEKEALIDGIVAIKQQIRDYKEHLARYEMESA